MDSAAPAGRTLNRAIWAIALPAMITNVATALFGLADIWVIGRLGDASAQAGVELGAKLLMGLLIVFNFLRMGTVGLTAQSSGRHDDAAGAAILVRALALATVISLLLFAIRPLAVGTGLHLLAAEGAVADQAARYVDIRYWGALPWLLNAALTGWLIGLRRMRAVLAIEVGANLAHIALDIGLVLGLGWGVAGVATATLLSECAKLLALAAVASRQPAAVLVIATLGARATWRLAGIFALLQLSRDLFFRTLLLSASILLMTRVGAKAGPVTLAANGVLFQFFMLVALILDGFESAAQVLGGHAVGSNDRRRFVAIIWATLRLGAVASVVIAVAMLASGPWLAASFSRDPAVVAATGSHIGWIAILAVAGVASFVLDGVFIGANWTRAMLGTMLAAFLAFGAALAVVEPLGNHGLWLAFTLFLIVRGAGQALCLPRLIPARFG